MSLRLTTDQFSAGHFPADASQRMLMFHHFRFVTDQPALCVIAFTAMQMGNQLSFSADQFVGIFRISLDCIIRLFCIIRGRGSRAIGHSCRADLVREISCCLHIRLYIMVNCADIHGIRHDSRSSSGAHGMLHDGRILTETHGMLYDSRISAHSHGIHHCGRISAHIHGIHHRGRISAHIHGIHYRGRISTFHGIHHGNRIPARFRGIRHDSRRPAGIHGSHTGEFRLCTGAKRFCSLILRQTSPCRRRSHSAPGHHAVGKIMSARIALTRVDMSLDLRQRASQDPVLIASLIMGMQNDDTLFPHIFAVNVG